MPKNRDYTGLVRTPSSMAWLIAESAKIKGKIAKLERQHAEIPGRLAALRHQLDALAAVIPLHEVKVDPNEIAPVQEKRKPVTAYGKMTGAVYACLREHRTRAPLYTTEIALYVARECGLEWGPKSRIYLVERVRRRLKDLASEGEVVRHHSTEVGQASEGLWSLSDD